MVRPRISDAAVYGLLFIAATVTLLLPRTLTVSSLTAAEETPPAQIRIAGVARDFRQAHPDFDVVPDAGYGHYAATIDPNIDNKGRPTLSADGYKVATEWQDSEGRPIAPHQYNRGGGSPLYGFTGISVARTVRLTQQSEIDAAPGHSAVVTTNSTAAGSVSVTKNGAIIEGDVFAGPGADPAQAIRSAQGGTITGLRSALAKDFEIPQIVVPADLGPSLGDVTYSSDTTISEDLHVDSLSIQGATVTISGAVTILCDVGFGIRGPAELRFEPGATLELYISGQPDGGGSPGIALFENTVDCNVDTADASRFTIYYLGSSEVHVENQAKVVAGIYAPHGELNLANSAHVVGNYVGDKLTMTNSTWFTVKDEFGGDPGPACVTLADVNGAAGAPDTGGISSHGSFGQWYRDVMGQNMSASHTITLNRDHDGVYEYLTDAFHPIDDRLLGNEGDAHNRFLTYSFVTTCAYEECTGQFLEFDGGDGAWLFVNDELVMDIGGVRSHTEQYVDFNRLGLVDGEEMELRFFYAQRDRSEAVFRLRTNLQIESDAAPAIVSGIGD